MAAITMESGRGRLATTASSIWSTAMIAVGALAIVLPLTAGPGIANLLAWVITIGGAVHVAHSLGAHRLGVFFWHALIGAIHVAGGGFLLLHPAASLATLTLVLAAVFFAEGVLLIGAFLHFRRLRGAGWFLAEGIPSFLLGGFIVLAWPLGTAWMIGTLIGISLIVSGASRLMQAGAARHASLPSA